MADTWDVYAQGTVDTSVETVLTAAAAGVFRLVVTNNTAGAVTGVTAYINGTGDANCVIPGIDLAAGEMLTFGPFVLGSGDTLALKSVTGDDVAGYTVFGLEV